MSRQKQAFPFRVKTALLLRGETVTALARRIGRNRATVSVAIHRGKYPETRRRIARALDL